MDRAVKEAQLARAICQLSEPCAHCWSAARKVIDREDDVRRLLAGWHRHLSRPTPAH